MAVRDQLRRLRRDAQEGAVLIKLRDGTTKVFDDLTCWKEMFLAQYDLFKGKARESEVLDAVRAATPESRAAFEAEYGSIELEAQIIAADYQGGWVDVLRLEEDGTVTKVHHPGYNEEARRNREDALNQGPAFCHYRGRLLPRTVHRPPTRGRLGAFCASFGPGRLLLRIIQPRGWLLGAFAPSSGGVPFEGVYGALREGIRRV